MKTVLNIVLGVCVLALVWICYDSIMGPINFEKAQKERESAVIARLIDIRQAQQHYRATHRGQYVENFDTLINFVKTQKLPLVKKEGELTDEQMKEGITTEKKAMSIINRAQKTGNYSEVKKYGLENFKRDTMWVSMLDTVYPKGFNPDSMRYIPYGNGAQFELNTRTDSTSSGSAVYLFEVKAAYETYLGGLNHQEIVNLKDMAEKTYRYPGLMIGSLETPNNGTGNWE